MLFIFRSIIPSDIQILIPSQIGLKNFTIAIKTTIRALTQAQRGLVRSGPGLSFMI